MSEHSTFEVHLTPHPEEAEVVTGLSEQEARDLAETADGVIVERRMSLDAIDALPE